MVSKNPFLTGLLVLVCSFLFAQQDIVVSLFDLEDGMTDRHAVKVQRDGYGYFYFIYENGIQKFDGEYFYNVDISILERDEILFSDIEDFFLDNEKRLILDFANQSKLYYIQTGGLEVKAIEFNDFNHPFNVYNVDSTAQILYTLEDSIYYKTVDEKGFNQLYFNRFVGQEIDYVIDLDSIAYVMDNYLQVYEIAGSYSNRIGSGKIELIQGKMYLFLKDRIEIYGAKKEIYPLEVDFLFPMVFHVDRNSNVIALYHELGGNDVYNIYTIIDGELSISNQFISSIQNASLTDVYSDDIKQKLMITSWNGIFYLHVSYEGIQRHFYKDEINAIGFGHLVRSCLSTEEDGILFHKETRGPYRLKDDQVDTLLEEYYLDGYFENNLHFIDLGDREYFTFSKSYSHSDYTFFNLDTEEVTSFNSTFISNDAILLSKDSTILGVGQTYQNEGSLVIISKNGILDSIVFDAPTFEDIFDLKSQNQLILGSSVGAFLLNQELNRIDPIVGNGIPNDFSQAYIYDIIEYQHYIVFGTSNGLYVLDPENDYSFVKNIQIKGGKSNNKTNALIEFDGKLWIGSFNGVHVVDSSLNVIKSLYSFDGFHTAEMSRNGITKTEDYIYLASNNGLLEIEPELVLKRKESYGFAPISLVYEDGVKSYTIPIQDYQAVAPLAETMYLQYELPDYNQKLVSVPSYNIQINNELVDIDPLSKRIYLKDLKDGINKYKIKSLNSYYDIELKIIANRDYTNLLIFIGVVIVGSIISWFIISFLNRRNKRISATEMERNKKMNALKLNALRSQMNPHFIFNALGAVQYFIQVNEADKADDYLTNFAQLIREILESSKMEMIPLKEEIKMLKLYAQLEQQRFDDKFEVNFTVDPRLKLSRKIHPMIIQPFIENAINHGVYHLIDRKGIINITFEYISKEELVCVVEDNGIGRKKADKFRRIGHKSRGMQIVNERIEALQSNQSEEIKINIEDVKQGTKVMGTKVTIGFIKRVNEEKAQREFSDI